MMRRFGIIALLFAVGVGCSDSEPTEPDPTPSSIAPGTFSALYNSEAISSDSGKASGTSSGAGRFQVVAYDSSRTAPISMVLSLYNIDKPGIYPMGVTESAIGGSVDLKVGGALYHQLGTGNGGTIVLTHVSATRLAGKFFISFLYPTEFGPAGSNVTMTEASFDVPISASAPIAVPENKGSWAVGTIGSRFFRSALFEINRDFTGAYTLRAGNFDYQIFMGFHRITGPGIYVVGPEGNGGIHAQTQQYDWGIYPNEIVGTMTIDRFTSDRIAGSINVTLRPGVGSERGGPLPIRFNFDLGLAPP